MQKDMDSMQVQQIEDFTMRFTESTVITKPHCEIPKDPLKFCKPHCEIPEDSR